MVAVLLINYNPEMSPCKVALIIYQRKAESRMAKGKYQDWLTPEGLLKIGGWAKDGLTNEQIASNMGISRKTLQEWCVKYSDISDTLKKNKEVADRMVENALLKKTIGYNVEVRKVFKCKKIVYDPDTGKRLEEVEELKIGVEEVHIPADTTAQIFWLKNRKPDTWRDRINPDTEPIFEESDGFIEALKEGAANVWEEE